MRVLLLTDVLSNGGLERQLDLLATNPPEGCEMHVVSLGGGPFVGSLRSAGVPVLVCERTSRFGPTFAPCLWRAIASWRPDVVHSWGSVSTITAAPLCRLLGIPLVEGTIRTATPPTDLPLKRLAVSLGSVVVANTRAALVSWHVPERKGRVVYNGFDERRLTAASAVARDGHFRVVMVGRMEAEKDYGVVIDAARALAAEQDGWRFSLLGSGSRRPAFEAQAAGLVERGVVEFGGGGIEVLGEVARADVGVLMTDPRLAREGCSNALMEYMACGLPVVCGDGGGNPEIVGDGVTGFIIPQRDARALADRLRVLRDDPELRARMGEAGRARVLGEMSVARMAEAYRMIYDEVTAGLTRSPAGREAAGAPVAATVASAPAGSPAGAAAPASARGLRILLLGPHPGARGPLSTIVPTLVAQLEALGCTVKTDSWSRHAEEESLVAKVVGRSGDLARVLAHLARGRFDVLFVPTAHTWPGLVRDVPLLLLAKGLSSRTVVHFHGSYAERLNGPGHRVFRALSRLLVCACDAVLLLSTAERDAWAAFEPRVRFEVVLNPYVSARPGDWARPRADGGQARPDEPCVVLFAGRLMNEKGMFDLLEAVAMLVDDGLDLRLVAAGDGPDAQAFRDAVTARGMGGRVDLLGHVGTEELRAAYAAADVFGLPTYWAEGFPTVILEAMDAGLPVITTPIRGAVDELEEGVNVLFVPERRPDAVADALRRLAGDPDLRERMGRANRLKVREFAPERVVPRYLEIMTDVVDGRAGS